MKGSEGRGDLYGCVYGYVSFLSPFRASSEGGRGGVLVRLASGLEGVLYSPNCLVWR
jgi:hypothetical protein